MLSEKVFLETSENSQENTSARVSFSTLLIKRLGRRCFPVSFAKFLITTFLSEHLRWLLLLLISIIVISSC